MGSDLNGQINDPTQPYKRLQKAIDECFVGLVVQGVQPGEACQAIVYAQPGVYGPAGLGANGPNASGDVLPIQMRDRVHVTGIRVRDCILRGFGDPLGATVQGFFPNQPNIGGNWAEDSSTNEFAEILLDLSKVDFGYQGPGGGQPPWYDPNNLDRDTLEVFQGFTFQSGDIQVWCASGTAWNAGARAVVANCVFDMRNGYAVQPAPGAPFVTVSGPTFGVMLNKQFLGQNPPPQSSLGYTDQRIMLLGNTFVFGRFEDGIWKERCLDDAVGVIDVNDTGCVFNAAGTTDCDLSLRGVGNCALVNNLFRTFPFDYGAGAPKPMAMLGVDPADTTVVAGIPQLALPTNAFAPSRVGSSNGGPAAASPFSPTRPIGLFSNMVKTGVVTTGTPPSPDTWDCGGASFSGSCTPPGSCPSGHLCTTEPPPVPAVAIYDGAGTPGIDPGFVGEFLPTLSPSLTNNVDWRILPGSPLKDAGFVPDTSQSITLGNGFVFDFSTVMAEANPFTYDGEGHGNPRVVENSIDIGFDEIHLFTMAGSYSNDSNSHSVAGSLNPELPQAGNRRWVILPKQTSAMPITPGKHVIIHSKMQAAPAAGLVPTAWCRQPATLYRPVIDTTNLPQHYQTRYIAFNDTAPPGVTLPTPWVRTLVLTDLQNYQVSSVPPGQQPISPLVAFPIDDDECAATPCAHWYFNSEVVVRIDLNGSDVLWSNLQSEFR